MAETDLQAPLWRKPLDMFASTRVGAAMFAPILHLIDRPLLRLSKGRLAMTYGLPTALVTTTGARSGKPRSVPLLSIPYEGDLAIIGTRFGNTKHPAWYYNLLKTPEATVLRSGEEFAVTAREATADERGEIWSRATQVYGGYDKYLTRVGGRVVPIFVLTRVEAD